ncbi:MAG: HlyD family type I secretion periplasmic adaptor subunit [Alsobacter sp.]
MTAFSNALDLLKPARLTGDSLSKSLQRHLHLSLFSFVVLFCGFLLWAGMSDIAGAVIASGQLVVESNVKKIQHPNGGVIAEVKVRDGDRVRAGDLLIRLDETVARANLAIVEGNLQQLSIRLARLEAERDGDVQLKWPDILAPRSTDPGVVHLVESEQNLLTLRIEARAGQKSQLDERRRQLEDEIVGLTGQLSAKETEVELINKELVSVKALYRKNLVSLQRVNMLERDTARLLGEKSALQAAIAQTKGKISEINLQKIQIDQDNRSDVVKEIRETQSKVAELLERQIASRDFLSRVEMRAPQDGVVHQLAVHTIGGVVGAGDTLLQVVPENDELRVEARIAPHDIDSVRKGQPVNIRLTAFSQRVTPEVPGEVLFVSPDLIIDPKTGLSFYAVTISMKLRDNPDTKSLRVVPGMPVEAFIQTNPRTVLSYLLKPISDQLRRAFRER